MACLVFMESIEGVIEGVCGVMRGFWWGSWEGSWGFKRGLGVLRGRLCKSPLQEIGFENGGRENFREGWKGVLGYGWKFGMGGGEPEGGGRGERFDLRRFSGDLRDFCGFGVGLVVWWWESGLEARKLELVSLLILACLDIWKFFEVFLGVFWGGKINWNLGSGKSLHLAWR